jgi:hypothetical protein
MHDHFPPGAGRTFAFGWTQEMLADKALVAPTALDRLESESELKVREDTRGQVHRARERGNRVFGLRTERRGDAGPQPRRCSRRIAPW